MGSYTRLRSLSNYFLDERESTITVQRTRTFPTGSYASEKIMLGYESPIPTGAEPQQEMRKALALLDVLIQAEVIRFKKNGGTQT